MNSFTIWLAAHKDAVFFGFMAVSFVAYYLVFVLNKNHAVKDRAFVVFLVCGYLFVPVFFKLTGDNWQNFRIWLLVSVVFGILTYLLNRYCGSCGKQTRRWKDTCPHCGAKRGV